MIHGVGIMSSTSTFLHLFSSKSLCVVLVLTGHSLCMTIRLRSGIDCRRTQFQNQSSFTNLFVPDNLLMKTSSPNKMPNILAPSQDGSLMPYLTIKGRQKYLFITSTEPYMLHRPWQNNQRAYNFRSNARWNWALHGPDLVLNFLHCPLDDIVADRTYYPSVLRKCGLVLPLTDKIVESQIGRAICDDENTDPSKSAISPRTHLHVLATEKLHALPELHVPSHQCAQRQLVDLRHEAQIQMYFSLLTFHVCGARVEMRFLPSSNEMRTVREVMYSSLPASVERLESGIRSSLRPAHPGLALYLH